MCSKQSVKETEGEESIRSSEFVKAHMGQDTWRFAPRNNDIWEI